VYNVTVAEPRDEFPNNFVGDLVKTERGWVVVPPTCCPAGRRGLPPRSSDMAGSRWMTWS
jgi:hypothetical protein